MQLHINKQGRSSESPYPASSADSDELEMVAEDDSSESPYPASSTDSDELEMVAEDDSSESPYPASSTDSDAQKVLTKDGIPQRGGTAEERRRNRASQIQGVVRLS